MRAVLMTAVGGPEVLELAEVPEPEPDVVDGRAIRVRLRAAGINPVDYKLRSGGTIGGRLPAVLGWDGAGLVDQVGSGVTRFRPGDEVYFCDGGFGPTPGTYQEVKVLDEAFVARKPSRLSFVEAAAAPLVTITAWEAMLERARVAEGQRVLVQAGAGGVGHMSVQIARIAGARVATTVSGEEKSALATAPGAELLIDYRREDVERSCVRGPGQTVPMSFTTRSEARRSRPAFPWSGPTGISSPTSRARGRRRQSRRCTIAISGCPSPGCRHRRCSAGATSANANGPFSNAPASISTPAASASKSARRSRSTARPTPTEPSRRATSSAKPS